LIDELTLTAGPPANGGSCVARHEGRVVFVRYALPGERVRVRVVTDKDSYWHADVVEVLEASPDRIEPLCAIAGVDGAGAVIWPSSTRRRRVASRVPWWPTSWPNSAGTTGAMKPRQPPNRSVAVSRRGGAHG
jgi:predicted RNA-binding protein with TRAM domain